MLSIIHLPSNELRRPQVERLLRLQDVVWPNEKQLSKPMEERIDAYLKDMDDAYETLLLEEDGNLLAHAEIFPRIIHTTNGRMEIMGLASVCSPPERRGEGFGKLIVQKAFKEVDDSRFRVSLFQTRVPGFYVKFGARIIDNPCINSLAEGGIDRSPWWNPYAMIYPGNFPDWPEGEVDLLRKGY